MQSATNSMASSVSLSQRVTAHLLDDNHREGNPQSSQSLLNDFFDRENGAQPYERARQLLGQIGASPAPLAARERAAKALCSTLSDRLPSFEASLHWPQVDAFGDRITRRAMDPLYDLLPEGSVEEGTLEEDKIDLVYEETLNLLPTEWFRVHAGLAVSEEISFNAANLYAQSDFCLQAEEYVENFALGPWALLQLNPESLSAVSPSDLERSKKVCALLTALHPSFADEIDRPGVFSSENWEKAVAHRVCRLFDEPMVAAAENMFASVFGQELFTKLPRIIEKLEALGQSAPLAAIAEPCVQQAAAKYTVPEVVYEHPQAARLLQSLAGAPNWQQ